MTEHEWSLEGFPQRETIPIHRVVIILASTVSGSCCASENSDCDDSDPNECCKVLRTNKSILVGALPQFWMVIHKENCKSALPDTHLISHRGTLGEWSFVISCDGCVVHSKPLSGDRSALSITLGGMRSGGVSGGDVAVEVNPSRNSVAIRVPLTSVTDLYSKTDPGRVELASDLKFLFSSHMEIDQRAIYSLLQFGVLIPPLTPWRQVTRLIPGNVYEVSCPDMRINCRILELFSSAIVPTDLTLPVHRQCEELGAELDRTLKRLCPDHRPVILFSGGVDSGVLAARAAAMGWKETLLVNCRMSSDDPESDHAAAMAHHLGLPYEEYLYSPHELEDYLSKLASTYPIPLGNISAYPSALLAKAIVDGHQDYRIALDGTGADGAFGLVSSAFRWRRITHLPRVIRSGSGLVYKAGKMWTKGNSRIGRNLGKLYTSAQMPILQASVARNPLSEIAYHFPDHVRSETQTLLGDWLDSSVPWKQDISPQLVSALDLILICCGLYAKLRKAIFDASPIEVRYPFLEPNMVKLGLERAIHWPGTERGKLALKNLLAQHVPREMVFRPKSTFVPPIKELKELLQSPAFLKALDKLLEPTNPVSSTLNLRFTRRLQAYLKQGKHLPLEIHNFIWSAVFTGLWLDEFHKHTTRT